MEITIDRQSPVPIYLQISHRIRDLIRSGQLPDGFRLPPERRLARALGVNRSTVLSAYRELKADGLLDAHVGRGTAVVPAPHDRREVPTAEAPAADIAPLPWRQLARHGVLRGEDPLLRDLLELSERRDVIALSVGLPAPELIPTGVLHAIERDLFDREGGNVLMHSPTEGVTGFREQIGGHMTSRGIHRDVPEIMVTSGSQQSLDLVARTFLEPGDLVVVEEPSYFGALQVLRGARARLASVPIDAEGLRTDVLAALLARERPKLIYTLPTFQNPSGAVMSLARRRALLELAYRYQVPIVEDDPYSELRYDGEPLPSLAALDAHGHVIYLSSFSKMLFPGFRLGWVAAPRAVVRQLTLVKQAIDLHSGTLGQMVLSHFLAGGHLERHLRTVRRAYAERRDAMNAALAAVAPRELSFERPSGGFYFWCRLPGGTSATRLLAAAADERVSFLPGAACFAEDGAEPYVRLCFSCSTPDEIREGVARFGRALAATHARPEPAGATGTAPIV